MKRALLLALVASPLVAGCVTSSDLQRVTDAVAVAERTAASRYATQAEVSDAFADVGRTVEEVAKAAEERVEVWWESTEGLAGGGLLGAVTGLALNMYRNSQRRRRGEPVTVLDAAKAQ